MKKTVKSYENSSYVISDLLFGWILNLMFFLITVFILYTVAVGAYNFGKDVFVEKKDQYTYEEVTVTIPDGASTHQIGKILLDSGLVKNDYVFMIQARLNGMYSNFRSGEFKLNKNMTSTQIMKELERAGKTNELKVTVIEGMTISQIADYLENQEIFGAEEFLAACRERYDYGFLPEDLDFGAEYPLEGYLFPDTYFLPGNPEPRDLIVRMLDRFDDIFGYEYTERAAEMGLSVKDAVTVASIIEKEVRVAGERRLASAVIRNRLEKDLPLQMCSTVIYVLGKRKDRLTTEDLQVESPYNTYTFTGLPAGPICNPGEKAIEAALNPADADYLYFVVKDEETGEHAFTDDYNEFLRYKDLYNQQF